MENKKIEAEKKNDIAGFEVILQVSERTDTTGSHLSNDPDSPQYYYDKMIDNGKGVWKS